MLRYRCGTTPVTGRHRRRRWRLLRARRDIAPVPTSRVPARFALRVANSQLTTYKSRSECEIFGPVPASMARAVGSSMITVVPPTTASASAPRAVGIFWLVKGVLIVDRSTLDAAEPYGTCITRAAGHYERWQEWQTLGAARLIAIGNPEIIAVSGLRITCSMNVIGRLSAPRSSASFDNRSRYS
jgi:hypothetical protein